MASTSMPEKPHRLRSILLRPRKPLAADQNPLLVPPAAAKKKGFAAVALRGLGCSTSSAKVHAPSAAATKGSGSPRKKRRGKKEERDQPAPPLQETPPQSAAVAEVGIGFSENNDEAIGRGAVAAAEVEEFGREDCYSAWQSGAGRRSSLIGSPQSHIQAPVFGSELGNLGLPRHLRRSWRVCSSPGLLEELMMFDAGLLLGEMDVFDQYRELRLDVDNMTYEELLELGDSIGYVNTGLQEEEIICCMRKAKHSIFNPLLQLSAEIDRKCSICLDEYRAGDEVGKLECGHGYHTCCIKKWLLRKNSCPVCKAAVGRS